MKNRALLRWFPFLLWFPLQAGMVRGDLIAGITGALILAPKAMSYAQLSGLPLQFGLYTAFIPAILGAMWGSSRHLATGPVAIASLMTASAVIPLATPNSEEYIGFALLLTLLVGLIQLVMGLVKLGNLVNFVSHPVILGFMNAAALIIALSQLDLLLGIPKGRSAWFLGDVGEMLLLVGKTDPMTLAMSLFSLVLMLAVRRVPFLEKPGVLVVIVVTTLLSAAIGYEVTSTCRLADIATGETATLLRAYDEGTEKAEAMGSEASRLTGRLRAAEKAGDGKGAADIRYRLDLLELDLAAQREENTRRWRDIARVSLVRGTTAEDGTARFYAVGRLPAGVHSDGRRWHVKKIDRDGVRLVGGGEVVGNIPGGLPSFRLPAFSFDALLQLLSSALVIALVAFMESISMAKAVAGKVRQRIDPNQELVGQGLANIGGSLFQSYPACGSFTATAVNFQAGARTGLAMVCNGVCIALILLFFTTLLYHLPLAVLAANNLMAVIGLVTIRAFSHTWKASRSDGIVAVVTFVVTLLAAPHLDKGIIVGAILAVGLHLYHTMAPRVALLGRYEDGTLRDLKVHPGLTTSSHVTVMRFDGSLYFANVAHFEDAVLAAVAERHQARYLLVVGDGINYLDASGEEMLHNLVVRLQESGVETVFSGLKKQVLDVMRRTGLNLVVGEDNIFATEEQALADIARRLGEVAAGDCLLGGR